MDRSGVGNNTDGAAFSTNGIMRYSVERALPMYPKISNSTAKEEAVSDLTIKVITGSDPAFDDYIPQLAQLRIEVFREFPYLYDGTLAYEQEYLATYQACPDSVVVLAQEGDQVVGASTGLPMAAETDEWQQPFKAAGIDVARLFYCGESVLRRSHRGRGIYRRFFQEREAHAKRVGAFELVGFFAVDRPQDHPRRPAGYQPLDPIWERFGYTRRGDLVAHYSWKDIDDEDETAKPLVFWLKPLAR